MSKKESQQTYPIAFIMIISFSRVTIIMTSYYPCFTFVPIIIVPLETAEFHIGADCTANRVHLIFHRICIIRV